MLLRRLLLFASLLLVMGAIASAIAPRRRDTTAPPRSAAGATPTDLAAAAPARRVNARLPGKPVRLTVGDIVSLHVSAPGPEQVDIPDLGLSEPADAGVPADFEFVADQPGRYPVVLGIAGRNAGLVEIAAKR
jgi:hypothetical protein